MKCILLAALLAFAGCSSDPDPAPGPAPEPARGPVAAPAPISLDRQVRVLFVEGAPRWEYRYLHNALARDASVELHCWLCSADPDFPQEHSLSPKDDAFRQSLREFPASMKELSLYDVLVLGDVGPRSLPEGSAALLAKFVEDFGGGLVVIAGEQEMPKGWKGTELERLLPVEADEALPESEEDLAYHLTDAGRSSALSAFGENDADSIRLWESGEGLRAVQWALAAKCRPEGTSLVEAGRGDRRVPLFVTAAHGSGRVFFSATDETWRWRFRSGDSPYFYPFWRRVIAWVQPEK